MSADPARAKRLTLAVIVGGVAGAAFGVVAGTVLAKTMPVTGDWVMVAAEPGSRGHHALVARHVFLLSVCGWVAGTVYGALLGWVPWPGDVTGPRRTSRGSPA